MITTRAEFHKLASEYRAIPVSLKLLADLSTPVAAFLRCVQDESGFILESVENGDRLSRFSFIGRRPHATLIARGNDVTIKGEIPVDSVPVSDGILSAVEFLLKEFKAPEIEGLPPLTSGLIGYFGYDVIREVEKLPDVPRDDNDYPDAVVYVIGELAVFDHWLQQVSLIAVALLPKDADESTIDKAYDDAVNRLDQLAKDGARSIDEPFVTPPEVAEMPELSSSSMSSEEYMDAVNAAKEYIAAGDIFQVVLSKRFDFDLEAEPIDVYRVLRQINPSPYMYFLRCPELTLVGCSPEPLVQVQGSNIISRPIAGTRPRGDSTQEDRALEANLIEDPKENAEHIMLVDLARNDLGRVVEYGSLNIDEMMKIEKYSHVMHLTSQVSGKKRPDQSSVDVLRATIPAGTVSGAPKVRAMEIIDELEPTKRGPYAGVVGYLDFSGNLDTAITIRTMYCGEKGASVQAGAGVVADSIPESEDEECWNKAKALLAAVKPARQLRREINKHKKSS